VSGPLRSEDDDPRPQQMVEDPAGYFADARARRGREVRAEHAGEEKPATLIAGVVKMSLRGATEDVERLVAAMRAAGIVVWRADSSGTKSGNVAGFQYFSVEVPQDAAE